MPVTIPRAPISALQVMGLLVAMSCLVVSTLASGSVYRWVDDSGQVHFTDTPPPKNAERIEFAPGSAGNNGLRQSSAQAQAAAQRRAQQCAQARQRRDNYLQADELIERGPDGDERVLDAGERRAAIARAQAAVSRDCETEQ